MNFNPADLDKDSLRQLKLEFDRAGDGFTEEQFVSSFAKVLGRSPEELTRLFLKIDANGDGSVDFSEFTSHLFSGASGAQSDDAGVGGRGGVGPGGAYKRIFDHPKRHYMMSQAYRGQSDTGKALARLAQTGAATAGTSPAPGGDVVLETARRLALASGLQGDTSNRSTAAAVVAGMLSGATPEQLELLGAGRNPMVVTEGGGASKFRKGAAQQQQQQRTQTVAAMQLLALFDAMGLREQLVDQTELQRKALEQAIRGEDHAELGAGERSSRAAGGKEYRGSTNSGSGEGGDSHPGRAQRAGGKGGSSQARGRDLVVAHVLERRSKIRYDVRSQLPITLSVLAHGPNGSREARAARASGYLPAVAESSGYSTGFTARLPRGTGHKDLISKVIFVPSTQAQSYGSQSQPGAGSSHSDGATPRGASGDAGRAGGSVGRYFSASMDGTICVWDANSKPGIHLRHGFRAAGAPVKDMVWLSKAQMLAVATAGSIQIFGVNSLVGTVHLHGRISHSLLGHAQPMCMATYIYKSTAGGRSSHGTSGAAGGAGSAAEGSASLVKAAADAAAARAQADAAMRDLESTGNDPASEAGSRAASLSEGMGRQSVVSMAASAAAQAAAEAQRQVDGDAGRGVSGPAVSRLRGRDREILLVGDDKGFVHKIEFERDGWHIFVLDEEFSQSAATECLLPEMGGGWGAAIESDEPAETLRARRRRGIRRKQAREAAKQRLREKSMKLRADADVGEMDATGLDPEGVGVSEDALAPVEQDNDLDDLIGLEEDGLGDLMPRSGAAHLRSGLATERLAKLKQSGDTVDWRRFRRLRNASKAREYWTLSGAKGIKQRTGVDAAASGDTDHAPSVASGSGRRSITLGAAAMGGPRASFSIAGGGSIASLGRPSKRAGTLVQLQGDLAQAMKRIDDGDTDDPSVGLMQSSRANSSMGLGQMVGIQSKSTLQGILEEDDQDREQSPSATSRDGHLMHSSALDAEMSEVLHADESMASAGATGSLRTNSQYQSKRSIRLRQMREKATKAVPGIPGQRAEGIIRNAMLAGTRAGAAQYRQQLKAAQSAKSHAVSGSGRRNKSGSPASEDGTFAGGSGSQSQARQAARRRLFGADASRHASYIASVANALGARMGTEVGRNKTQYVRFSKFKMTGRRSQQQQQGGFGQTGSGTASTTGTPLDVDQTKQWINVVKYIPGAEAIVAGTEGGEVIVVEADRPAERVVSCTTVQGGVTDLAWSDNSRMLAVCSSGSRTVALWSPYSYYTAVSLGKHAAPVVAAEFSDSRQQLLTLSKDLAVRVWDLRTQRCVQVLQDSTDSGQGSSALSRLIEGGTGGTGNGPRIEAGEGSTQTLSEAIRALGERWVPCMLLQEHTRPPCIMTSTRTLTIWPLAPMPGAVDAGQDSPTKESSKGAGPASPGANQQALYSPGSGEVASTAAEKKQAVADKMKQARQYRAGVSGVLALLPVSDPHDGTEDDEELWYHAGGGALRGVTKAMYSRGFDEILIAEAGTDTVSVWFAKTGKLLQQFQAAPPTLQAAAARRGRTETAANPYDEGGNGDGSRANAIASTCVVMDREERRVCIGTASGDFVSVMNPANGAHLRELCLLEGAGDPKRRAEAAAGIRASVASRRSRDHTVRSIVCVSRAMPGAGKNAPVVTKLMVVIAGLNVLVFDDGNPDSSSESQQLAAGVLLGPQQPRMASMTGITPELAALRAAEEEHIAAMVEGRQSTLAVRELLNTLTAGEVEARRRSARLHGTAGDEEDDAAARTSVRRSKLRQLMLRHGGGVEVARLLRAERERRSREIDHAAGRSTTKAAKDAAELREFERKMKRNGQRRHGDDDGKDEDASDADSVDTFDSHALVKLGYGIAQEGAGKDADEDEVDEAAEAGDGIERRGAVRSIPSVNDLVSDRCHSEPIAAAVFCPPDLLATAGMDGKILMWSLATGQHFRTIYEPESDGELQSWESLAYCPRVRSIAAVGEGRDIRIWSTESVGVWSRYQALPEAPAGMSAVPTQGTELPKPIGLGQRRPPLCCVTFDSGGEYLLVGRADGWMACCDVLGRREITAYERAKNAIGVDVAESGEFAGIHAASGKRRRRRASVQSIASSLQRSMDSLGAFSSTDMDGKLRPGATDVLADPEQLSMLRPVACWRAHRGRISSLQVLESPKLVDTFVLSAGATDGGRVALWTMAGLAVAVIGAGIPFDLSDPDTYLEHPKTSKPRFVLESTKADAMLLELSKPRASMQSMGGTRRATRRASIDIAGRLHLAIEPKKKEGEESHGGATGHASSSGMQLVKVTGQSGGASMEELAQSSTGFHGPSKIPQPGEVWIRRRVPGGLRARRMYAQAASQAASTEDELEEAKARAEQLHTRLGGMGLPGDDFGNGSLYASEEKHAEAIVKADQGVVSDREAAGRLMVEEAGGPAAFDIDGVTALISVIRVTKDDVVGLDGLQGGLVTVFVPLDEFSAPDPREQDPWMEVRPLSMRVGRLFRVLLPEEEIRAEHREYRRIRNEAEDADREAYLAKLRDSQDGGHRSSGSRAPSGPQTHAVPPTADVKSSGRGGMSPAGRGGMVSPRAAQRRAYRLAQEQGVDDSLETRLRIEAEAKARQETEKIMKARDAEEMYEATRPLSLAERLSAPFKVLSVCIGDADDMESIDMDAASHGAIVRRQGKGGSKARPGSNFYDYPKHTTPRKLMTKPSIDVAAVNKEANAADEPAAPTDPATSLTESPGTKSRRRRGRLASITAVKDSQAAIQLTRRLRDMESDVYKRVNDAKYEAVRGGLSIDDESKAQKHAKSMRTKANSIRLMAQSRRATRLAVEDAPATPGSAGDGTTRGSVHAEEIAPGVPPTGPRRNSRRLYIRDTEGHAYPLPHLRRPPAEPALTVPAQLVRTIEAAARLQAVAAQSMSDQARAATLADKSKVASSRAMHRRRQNSNRRQSLRNRGGSTSMEDSYAAGGTSMTSLVTMAYSGLVTEKDRQLVSKKSRRGRRRRTASGVAEDATVPDGLEQKSTASIASRIAAVAVSSAAGDFIPPEVRVRAEEIPEEVRFIPSLHLPPPPVFLPRRSLSLFRRDELARRKHRRDCLGCIESWFKEVKKSRALVRLLAQTVDLAANSTTSDGLRPAEAGASAGAFALDRNSMSDSVSGADSRPHPPSSTRNAPLLVGASTSRASLNLNDPTMQTVRSRSMARAALATARGAGRPPPSPMRTGLSGSMTARAARRIGMTGAAMSSPRSLLGSPKTVLSRDRARSGSSGPKPPASRPGSLRIRTTSSASSKSDSAADPAPPTERQATPGNSDMFSEYRALSPDNLQRFDGKGKSMKPSGDSSGQGGKVGDSITPDVPRLELGTAGSSHVDVDEEGSPTHSQSGPHDLPGTLNESSSVGSKPINKTSATAVSEPVVPGSARSAPKSASETEKKGLASALERSAPLSARLFRFEIDAHKKGRRLGRAISPAPGDGETTTARLLHFPASQSSRLGSVSMPGAGLSIAARRAKEQISAGDSPFLSGTRIDEVVGSSTKGMAWRAEYLERYLQQTLGPRLRGVLGGDFSSRAMAAADPDQFIRDSIDKVLGDVESKSGEGHGAGGSNKHGDNHEGTLLEGHGVGDNVRAALGLHDARASLSSLQSVANREMPGHGAGLGLTHAEVQQQRRNAMERKEHRAASRGVGMAPSTWRWKINQARATYPTHDHPEDTEAGAANLLREMAGTRDDVAGAKSSGSPERLEESGAGYGVSGSNQGKRETWNGGITSRQSSVAVVAKTIMREDLTDGAMPTFDEEDERAQYGAESVDVREDVIGVLPSTPGGTRPRVPTPREKQTAKRDKGSSGDIGVSMTVTEQVLRAKAHADMRGMGPVRMAQLSPRAPTQLGAEPLELPSLDDMPRHYKTVLNAVTHPSHRLLELSDGLQQEVSYQIALSSTHGRQEAGGIATRSTRSMPRAPSGKADIRSTFSPLRARVAKG